MFALQVVPVSLSLSAQAEMDKSHVFITPLNYFQWNSKMVIHFRSKFLYRVSMGTETEPNSVVEKSKYFNRLDEAFRMLFLSILRDIIFVDVICNFGMYSLVYFLLYFIVP